MRTSPSLGQAVASIQQDLRRVTTALHEAKQENATLRAELAVRPVPMSEKDLESLRRGIVFRCHPDRGGDSALLRRVLELFDLLSEK